MATTVMSGAARALVMDLEARGVNAAPLLAKAGLTREDVFDPDHRLPAGVTEQLWLAASPHLPDPLTAAAQLPLGAYRVLDFLSAHSETVGAGLQRFAAYFPLVDPRIRMIADAHAVDDDGGAIATLTMVARDGSDLPGMAQSFTFAAIVHRFRQFSGVCWPLVRVEFAASNVTDVRAHAEFFGCTIRVNQPAARLVVSSATFAMPLPAGERELLPLLDQLARQQMAELRLEDEPVRGFGEAVRLACADGRPTLSAIARRLDVSSRSLQRRLGEAGTSFSAAVDRERERMARRHLAERGLSIAEIAFILGFSDQPAFTKAFLRWVGQTPHVYRKTHAVA
jgi:AraC-like DNA-binding protein